MICYIDWNPEVYLSYLFWKLQIYDIMKNGIDWDYSCWQRERRRHKRASRSHEKEGKMKSTVVMTKKNVPDVSDSDSEQWEASGKPVLLNNSFSINIMQTCRLEGLVHWLLV